MWPIHIQKGVSQLRFGAITSKMKFNWNRYKNPLLKHRKPTPTEKLEPPSVKQQKSTTETKVQRKAGEIVLKKNFIKAFVEEKNVRFMLMPCSI